MSLTKNQKIFIEKINNNEIRDIKDFFEKEIINSKYVYKHELGSNVVGLVILNAKRIEEKCFEFITLIHAFEKENLIILKENDSTIDLKYSFLPNTAPLILNDTMKPFENLIINTLKVYEKKLLLPSHELKYKFVKNKFKSKKEKQITTSQRISFWVPITVLVCSSILNVWLFFQTQKLYTTQREITIKNIDDIKKIQSIKIENLSDLSKIINKPTEALTTKK